MLRLQQPLWRILERLAHVVRQRTETNGREEVDGEARVLGAVHGEQAGKGRLQRGLPQPRNQRLKAHGGRKLQKELLDVNA